MKHNSSLILIAALLIGCVKVKKKGEEQNAPQTLPQQTQSESDKTSKNQTNNFEKLDIEYMNNQVEFQIPANWPDELIVETVLKDSTNKFQIKTENKIWKSSIPADDKVIYRFYARQDNTENLLGSVSVLPALDLHVKETLNLAQKYKIDSTVQKIYFKNLTLEKEAHLLLENFSGLLKIENLKADGGFLQTFELGKRAAFDQPGRSGGKVKIEIIKGGGELNIFMLGENGGNGSPGADPDESMRGARGEDGKGSQFTADACSNANSYFPHTCYGCITKPGPATNGGKGSKGRAGQNGQNGGNSGSVQVYLSDANLVINLFKREGRRGEKGLGGRGGAGGHPGFSGDGGTIDFIMQMGRMSRIDAKKPENSRHIIGIELSKTCEPAPDAFPGAEGARGEDGFDGNDGLALQSELYLKNIKSTFNNEKD